MEKKEPLHQKSLEDHIFKNPQFKSLLFSNLSSRDDLQPLMEERAVLPTKRKSAYFCKVRHTLQHGS